MPVPTSTGAAVSIAGLVQRFASHTVLDRVDLDVPAGHVLALLGPSGCGKTTLLKLLAGLMRPTEGRIAIVGQTVVDANHFLPPEKRGLGMVFQDYALWPHMTVGRNVAFPLEMRGVGRREATTRVANALDLVGLGGYDARQPGSLSGGQQQRVALARAIVARPQLLLFDEPLSNLDRDLRESLCGEIGALLRELGATAVYVTHDHEEAFTLADTVAVMRGGRIQQMASPDALMNDPASLAVAEFLKLGAVAAGERTQDGWRLGQGIALVSPPGMGWQEHASAHLTKHAHGHAPGPGHLFIPHSALRPADAAPLRGTVVSQRYRSGHYATTVRVGPEAGGIELGLLTHARLPLHAPIGLELDWTRLRWFPLAA